jgi:hypothetical protein
MESSVYRGLEGTLTSGRGDVPREAVAEAIIDFTVAGAQRIGQPVSTRRSRR